MLLDLEESHASGVVGYAAAEVLAYDAVPGSLERLVEVFFNVGGHVFFGGEVAEGCVGLLFEKVFFWWVLVDMCAM